MKKIIISLTLILLMVGSVFFYAKPSLEQQIENELKAIGFDGPIINKSRFKFSGLDINQITLDEDGFNKLNDIKINLSWVGYLLKKEIRGIEIERIDFSAVPSRKTLFLLNNNSILKNLTPLPANEINIKNIVFDVATDEGAIRITGNINLVDKDDGTALKAGMKAAQQQLSFNTQWSGAIKKDSVTIDATINQAGLKYNFIKLNRGTGWLSYSTENGLAVQIDAGSGSISQMPINNINILVGQEQDDFPIVLRADASNIQDVSFSADMNYSKEPQKQSFSSVLSIKSLPIFQNYLEQLQIIENSPEWNLEEKQMNLKIEYQPEKRFVDGPYPFDLSILQNEKQTSNGTFLIYPKELDIRGTIQTTPDTLSIAKDLFEIPQDNIFDNTIRIDSNLAKFLEN